MTSISSKLSILLFGLIPFFGLYSCTTSPEETITIIEEICEDEQKLQDLKAFFNPFRETVFVTPDFREQVYLDLGLVPTSDPYLFEYQAFTIAGDLRPTGVFVEELPLEELQSMKEAVDAELFAIADEADNADSELMGSSSTYRRHECQQVDNARNTRCHAFPGYSTSGRHLDRWLCRPADTDDTCTEWVDVIGYSYRYNNSTNCTGNRVTTNLRGFTCR